MRKEYFSKSLLFVFSVCLLLVLLAGCDNGDLPDDPQEYTLEILEVEGQGTVNPSPGNYTLEENAMLDLTVTPYLGWEFKEWSANDGGDVVTVDAENGEYRIKMDADKQIRAVFEEIELDDPVELSINIDGEGTVDPPEAVVERDETVILTVIPDEGYVFEEWQGPDAVDVEAVVGEDDQWQIEMDEAKEITAVFSFVEEMDVVYISSNVDSPTTWEENTVYVIESNISVNALLTIEPGTIIKFEEGRRMIVNSSGGLNAPGIANHPIIFTSIKDDEHGGDTNQDGDFTVPAPGDWEYIRIYGTAVLDHCEFYYGGGSGTFDATLMLEGTTTVENSVFAYNRGDDNGALDARDGATIKNNIFYSNTKPLRLNANLSLDDSNIFHDPDNPEEKNTFQGIFINGISVTENISWEETEVPLVVRSNLTVRDGGQLTLGKGLIMKFDDCRLGVYGRLEAEGTADMPITFTSYKDDEHGGDSNGDGDFTSPAPGDWDYIRIRDAGTADFDYCEFYYGGASGTFDATLMVEGTTTVENSVFAYNRGDDNGALDARSGATIRNNVFYNNIKPIRLNASLSLDDSNIFYNPENTSERNQFEGIFIDGYSISEDVFWDETDIAFVVRSNLTVGENYSLDIGDYVTVKFDGCRLSHYGNISNYDGPKVVFTSYKDDNRGRDSNGDGDATSPADGDWYGIRNVSGTNYYESWSNIFYAENP